MKKFSIILPVKDGGAYVKECVNSILNQSISDFDLVILDNASADGTSEWIRSLRDSRIILHSSEKALVVEENWGRIRTIPKNQYMTLIGHDDILLPDYLAEMSDLIERYPNASLYQTHFNYIDGMGAVTRPCLPMDARQTSSEFVACQMCKTIDSTGTGYMMRSSDYDGLGGIPTDYPNLIFADYELWVKLISLGYKVTSPKQCFLYREHMSLSRQTNGELYFRAFVRYIDFISMLKGDSNIAYVISRYGKRFLLDYCESLSHRLLKTPRSERSINVSQLLKEFDTLAAKLCPSEDFIPEKRPKIRYARYFDKSALSRTLFKAYKAWLAS